MEELNYEEMLEEIYDKWLMEKYNDEISTKEDLIKLSEDGFEYEEFTKEVKKSIQV